MLVVSDQERLSVVGQLNLGAKNVHTRCGSGVVLVFGKFQQSAGVGYSRLGRSGARRGRLRIEVERGNGSHNQVARILLIHLAGIHSQLAGLEPAIAFEIDNVLLRIDAKIIVGKRPNYSRHPRQ